MFKLIEKFANLVMWKIQGAECDAFRWWISIGPFRAGQYHDPEDGVIRRWVKVGSWERSISAQEWM